MRTRFCPRAPRSSTTSTTASCRRRRCRCSVTSRRATAARNWDVRLRSHSSWAATPASGKPCTYRGTARWCPSRSPAPFSSTQKELAAMADTLTRRSPLHGYETRFANLPESATVADEPFTTMVDLWVDSAGPGGAAAAGSLGIDALPTAPSTTVSGRDVTAIWLGPEEWLITSNSRDGEDL